MQVVGGDPKRTSTSPAWQKLKHNSSIITIMGVAKLINCDPTTQSASARLPSGGTIYIPLRTLLSDMLRLNQNGMLAAVLSKGGLQDSSVRVMAIKSAQGFLEKNIRLREKNITANPVVVKKVVKYTKVKPKNKKRKRAVSSKASASASKARGGGLPSSSASSKAPAAMAAGTGEAPSLPIRATKKVRKARVRADKKELECDVCNKKFRLQHNLRAHKRTHTGEQPFQCKFPGCGKRFNHGGNLLKHERRHIPYEQRPYPCDVLGCGKRFMEACDLRTHKKGHSMKRSSYRGVTIERGRWKAQIGYGGKTHHIGTYDTDVDAAKAYDSEALRVHGAKALLNFPKKGQAGQIGTRKAPPKVRGKFPSGRKGGLLANSESLAKNASKNIAKTAAVIE